MPAASVRDGGRRPLTDAIHREHDRLLEGRREEGARGVALVVLGEEDLSVPALALPDLVRQPYLVLEPDRHRAEEARDSPGSGREVRVHQPLELAERLVVEHDVREVAGRDAGLTIAVVDGVTRVAVVVLLASEALFLRSRNDLAVAKERRGAVVIEGADPEYDFAHDRPAAQKRV